MSSTIPGAIAALRDAGAEQILVEATVRGTLILVAGALVVHAMRKSSAAARHLVWCAGLFGILALPVMTRVLPEWSVSVPEQFGALAPAHEIASPPVVSRAITPRHEIADVPTAPHAPAAADIGDPLPTAMPNEDRAWQPSVLDLWLAGVSIVFAAMAMSLIATWRLARRARPLTDERTQSVVVQFARRLGLSRRVRVLESGAATMPATCGILRPTVLLPADARDWSQERQRVVLLHELAHIKRHDCLTQRLAQICCAIFWFNPIVWYAASRMRAERELACDDAVLAAGTDACDYANELLEIARTLRPATTTALATLAMAKPTQLEGRLLAILEPQRSRRAVSRSVRLATAAGVVAVVVPLGGMRPVVTAAPSPVVIDSSVVRQPTIAVDTFRWSGRVPRGRWIEVHTVSGNVRAERARGEDVEVMAIARSGHPDLDRIAVWRMDRGQGSVELCAVLESNAPSGRRVCDGARDVAAWGDTRVDILVRVPAGVGFAGHTVHGDIVAARLEGFVWGTSIDGDVEIQTTDRAEASTVRGSIRAEFGTERWEENLEFLTENGDVTVRASARARTTAEVTTEHGNVVSDFALTTRDFGTGERAVGQLGGGSDGRGWLTLTTKKGNVRLLRGAVAPSERIDYAAVPSSTPARGRSMSSSSTRADSSPSPSPSPSPTSDRFSERTRIRERNRNADIAIDAAIAVETDIGENWQSQSRQRNPTGEWFSVRPPRDLDRRIRDALGSRRDDRQAIVQALRSSRHEPLHEADLVRERSEWTLTRVGDGSLLDSLAVSLRDPEWRVRAYAAWALASFGPLAPSNDRATAALVVALRDEHWRVRAHAAYALQALDVPDVVPALVGALDDEAWEVRLEVVNALRDRLARQTLGSLSPLAPLRDRLLREDHDLVRQAIDAAIAALTASAPVRLRPR
jgi:beta-lactamase regulating signal transducer with metallopeptidase domain